MTKQQLNEVFGLDSWFDLYVFIYKSGHATKDVVRLTAPIQYPHENPDPIPASPEWSVDMCKLKAMAFDELFPHVPHAESVLLIHEIVGEMAQCSPLKQSAQDVHTFLNNLPTRKQ